MPKQQKSSDSSPEVTEDSNLNPEETDVNDQDVRGEEADSSNADDSKNSEDEHQSLLDVVKNATDKYDSEDEGDKPKSKGEGSKDSEEDDSDSDGSEEDASSASDEKGKKDKSSKDTEEAKDDDEFTEEDLAKEKPQTQRRIRNLLGRLEDTHSQVENLKPAAEGYQQIESYMSDHGITPEEASEAFTIMALVKTDPAQALERMQGHVKNIASYVGDEMPDDIRQKVEDGILDEETGKELSKARAEARRERQKSEGIQQQYQQQQQQQQTAQTQQAVAQALDNWQASKSQEDPNYQQKHELVSTQLRALVAQYGTPRNAEEAGLYAEKAYDFANQQFQRLAGANPQQPVQDPQTPKYQPKREKRSIQSRASSGPSPKPKPETTLDVIKQTVGQ